MKAVRSLFGGKDTESTSKRRDEDEFEANLLDDGLSPDRRALVKNFEAAFACFIEVSTGSTIPFKSNVTAFSFQVIVNFDWPEQKAPSIKVVSLAEFLRNNERIFGIKEAECAPHGFKYVLNPNEMDVIEASRGIVKTSASLRTTTKRKYNDEDITPVEGRVIKKYRMRPTDQVEFPSVTPAAQYILDQVSSTSLTPLRSSNPILGINFY